MTENNLNIFWKNVSKLASGTIISQIVVILLTPIIARLYSPDDYGNYSTIISLVGIIVIVGSLRLERSIVLVDSAVALKLLNLCNSISLVISVGTLAFILFFHSSLNYLIKVEPYQLLFFTPLLVLTNSVLNSFRAYGNSFKMYSYLGVAIMTYSILAAVLKVLFGFFLTSSAVYLISSELISVIVTISFLLFAFNQSKIGFRFAIPQKAFVKSTIIEQKHFLKYDVVGSLINNFSWLMPVLLLSYFFDKSIVGYYTLGFTILRLPMNLLGKAIGEVYYKSASDTLDLDKLKTNTLNIVSKLFSFGLLPIVFVLFFGDKIFVLFFGDNWYTAGFYSQILSMWTLIWFITTPITNLYYIKNLQSKLLNFTIVSLILRASAFIIGGYYKSPVLSLSLFSLISALLYLFQLVYLFNKIQVTKKELFMKMFDEVKYSIIVIILLTIFYLLEINFLVTLITSVFTMLIYYLWIYVGINKLRIYLSRK